MKKEIKYQSGYYNENLFKMYLEVIEFLEKYLSDNKGKNLKILNAGCGDCYINLKIYAISKIKNFSIYSIDFDKRYKQLAQERSDFFIIGDVLYLEKYYSNSFFDIIIAAELIEHLDNSDLFIQNVKKVLKKEGLLIITTPNLLAYHCRLAVLTGEIPPYMELSREYGEIGKRIIGKLNFGNLIIPRNEYVRKKEALHHVNVFSYDAIRQLFELNNFKIILQRGIDLKLPFMRLFPKLCSHIFMVVQKKDDKNKK